MGTIGLPGGTDSVSRFVRATFTKLNSFCDPEDTEKNIAEFFHILSNVQQVNGETELKSGKYEITLYTSCLDTDDFRLYYNTYYNPSLNGVDGRKFDLDAGECSWIPFEKESAGDDAELKAVCLQCRLRPGEMYSGSFADWVMFSVMTAEMKSVPGRGVRSGLH